MSLSTAHRAASIAAERYLFMSELHNIERKYTRKAGYLKWMCVFAHEQGGRCTGMDGSGNPGSRREMPPPNSYGARPSGAG